jgi:NTE family protein
MIKTGLSLGGGSLRGVAHIGVLKELLKNEIEITHIAGTSAGAVIGGLYACGMSPEKMESVLYDLSVRRHLDFSVNKKGLIKGNRIYNTLLKLTDGRHFSDLNIPFSIICIDLISGESQVINSGELALAIQAGMAIPGIFPPIEMNGKLLVDGYILNNNPANIVRDMGAENVTSVRIRSSHMNRPENLLSFLNRYIDIASTKNTEQCMKNNTDILIDIDLYDIGRFDTKAFPRMIDIGEKETRKVLIRERQYKDRENVIFMEQWLRRTK